MDGYRSRKTLERVGSVAISAFRRETGFYESATLCGTITYCEARHRGPLRRPFRQGVEFLATPWDTERLMASQPNLFRAKVHALTLGIVLGLAGASIAWGQGGPIWPPWSPQVDPSVVTITLPNEREGSGFVVDAKGLVVTNYHVIEGAKTATVTFADKKIFLVDGFVAVNVSKDLALLHVQSHDKELPALRLAESLPAKGDRVFAFGAPMGLSGSVSDGIVAAIRPGQEVRETLLKLAHRDIYTQYARLRSGGAVDSNHGPDLAGQQRRPVGQRAAARWSASTRGCALRGRT